MIMEDKEVSTTPSANSNYDAESTLFEYVHSLFEGQGKNTL